MAPRQDKVDINTAQVLPTKKLKYSQSEVYNHIAKYAKADNVKAGIILGTTFAAYLVCYFLPVWFAPFHALLSMRLFMCIHDMAHGSYFSSQTVNHILGVICGAFTLTPYSWWKHGHNFHHDHSNDLNFQQGSQTAPFTVKEFLNFSPLLQLVYRIACVPYIMILAVAPFMMAIVQPLSGFIAIEWAWQISVWGVLYYYGLLGRIFLVVGISASLGVFLFHLQHTFEGTKREWGRDYFDNGIHGSTYLHVPFILQWATNSIEVHHIHHLNARVPLYNLQKCHDEAPNGMFDTITHITLGEGWKSLSLVLWDEETNKLIAFKELDERLAKQKQQ